MSKSNNEPLAVLLEEHEGLNTLFESHQRALLAKDVDSAIAILTKFQDSLLKHIRFEETSLLPKYAQEGGETRGGTLAIFQAEHQKLKALSDKALTDTLALYTAGDIDAQIIAIFDQETLFKGLFNHHAHRERNILVPGLKARTTPEEQMDLVQKHYSMHLDTFVDTTVERFADAFGSQSR